MSNEPLEYLRHIYDECIFIKSVIEDNFSKDVLMKDETLKRALVRSLEIIGEATKKIPVDFKLKWNSIN
jgi:uncharacterized protein with HEPN domain